MKRIILLMALLAIGGFNTHAAPPTTNSAAANRPLIIGPSSMPISPGGKATLTIGMLKRADGVYAGDYKIDISPYFFKSENGKLAIVVSDESIAKVGQGKVAAIVGTATGSDGEMRHIDAMATPTNGEQGKLKLWFMAGNRKMIFEPFYHFVETGTVEPHAPPPEVAARPNGNSRVPVSHQTTLKP